jgi:CysZ protein
MAEPRSVSVAGALLRAAGSLVHPRMLWLMLWPVLIALILWSTVAFFLLGWLIARLAERLEQFFRGALFFIELNFADWALIAAKVLLYLAFVPLVYMTALVILGVFGMPIMVDHVASRSYPGLERRNGGGFLGSAWNGVVALLGMLVLAVATLPLWLVPPLWPLIPLVVMGWANQRLLRYDALAEHADAEERRAIFKERRGGLYMLGFLLALAAYVPLVGFFVPAFFALGFIHYLLDALAGARRLSAPMTPMGTKNWPEGNAPP